MFTGPCLQRHIYSDMATATHLQRHVYSGTFTATCLQQLFTVTCLQRLPIGQLAHDAPGRPHVHALQTVHIGAPGSGRAVGAMSANQRGPIDLSATPWSSPSSRHGYSDTFTVTCLRWHIYSDTPTVTVHHVCGRGGVIVMQQRRHTRHQCRRAECEARAVSWP